MAMNDPKLHVVVSVHLAILPKAGTGSGESTTSTSAPKSMVKTHSTRMVAEVGCLLPPKEPRAQPLRTTGVIPVGYENTMDPGNDVFLDGKSQTAYN